MPEAPEIQSLSTRFVPAGRPSDRLAVVLHGLGDSWAGFTWMPGELNLPWLNYLLVNAPDAYEIGYSWYDIANPAPGVLRSRGLLNALFAELAEQGWESRNVLLFGFSQGCLMTIDFATRYAQPLAGIVGVSGYTFDLNAIAAEMTPQAREQAWLMTHGSHDELLPVSRTRAQVERLRSHGLQVEWHEFAKAHTIDPYDELPLFRSWIDARWA